MRSQRLEIAIEGPSYRPRCERRSSFRIEFLPMPGNGRRPYFQIDSQPEKSRYHAETGREAHTLTKSCQ